MSIETRALLLSVVWVLTAILVTFVLSKLGITINFVGCMLGMLTYQVCKLIVRGGQS